MAKRVVTVRLSDEEYADLKVRAEADGRSMEAVVRRAVWPQVVKQVSTTRVTDEYIQDREALRPAAEAAHRDLTASLPGLGVAKRNRKAVYADADEMDDSSTEFSRALHAIADNATASEDGEEDSFDVICEDEAVKQVIDDLCERAQLHGIMPSWTRRTVKYGDGFAEVVVNSALEVASVKQLPSETMERNEDRFGNLKLGEPEYTGDDCTNQPGECAFEQYDPQGQRLVATFSDWQIVHTRLFWDGVSKYGTSLANVARRDWRKLFALEEGMIIGRLTRAYLKLVIYADTTNMAPEQAKKSLGDLRDSISQTSQYVDRKRGKELSVLDNIYLSKQHVRTSDGVKPSQTEVSVIDPKNEGLTNITDVQYFQRKYLTNLIVPPAFMAIEDQVNAKATLCLTYDTKVSLLDGRELPIGDLVAEWQAGKESAVYSFDPETFEYRPGRITWAGQTSPSEKVWKVTLDNGESFKATGTHPVMLSNGLYRYVTDLRPEDSVMPLYRRVSSKAAGDDLDGYEMFRAPDGSWRYTHRMVQPAKGWASVRHHKDFNKRNNDPSNLEVMTWGQHEKYHRQHAAEVFNRPDVRAAQKASTRTAENRARRSLQLKRQWSENREVLLAAVRTNIVQAHAAPYVRARGEASGTFRRDASFGALVEAAERSNGLQDIRRISGYSESLIRRLLKDAGITYAEFAQAHVAGGYKRGAGQTHATYSRDFAAHPVWNKGLTKADAPQMSNSGRRVAVNHSVVSVEYVGEEAVYDISVEGYSNFALTAGVVVHNTKEDVQYVRFVRSVQKIMSGALSQVIDTELILKGYDPEQVDYEIKWPALSVEDEAAAAEAELKEAQSDDIYVGLGVKDKTYVQKHRFGMDEDEIAEIEVPPEPPPDPTPAVPPVAEKPLIPPPVQAERVGPQLQAIAVGQQRLTDMVEAQYVPARNGHHNPLRDPDVAPTA